MGGLGEPVDYRQNDSLALRRREPNDKVQRYETRDNEGLVVAAVGQKELAVESCSEHTLHVATKAETLGTIVGHQKRCRRKTSVRRDPG